MALSWNEIKDRAAKFSIEWAGTENEDAEAKPFLEAFFNVFGISRKKIASFEYKVKKLEETDGYIDLLWKGNLLVEMKSLGKNLDKAYCQAKDYLQGLKQHELPKYILVSDFNTFRLYDLEEDNIVEFKLHEFVANVQHFGFIAGYQKRTYKEQDPVNIKAAELMGRLHDKLKSVGYEGHPLEVYLVRLLFCLFADDTTIFEKDIFIDFIEERTSEDGSDLAARLSELFFILNTPKEKRLKNIDEQLNAFPYVNGKLFEEMLPPASFDAEMRKILLECGSLNWGKISPAIFGSMFQSVMNPKERRNLGAHYTSEKNILKLIKPLFLDELWDEFHSVKGNRNKLIEFHQKLSRMKFLDPACGCGNFLVITYRELRLLEIEILRTLYSGGQGVLDVREIILLDVDMMNGIEYEEFPARITEVAMWLIDHQMNMAVSDEFGQYYVRLPLRKSANIAHGNALQTDWEAVVPKSELSYILGNPPFVGKSLQNDEQKKDMVKVFAGVNGAGVLDYVTAWYVKAAQMIQDTRIKAAFVSTNSISQGEQVGILWSLLFNKYHIKIHFAHRTFKWGNEAKGNAAVHVVIIGFACFDIKEKYIFEYEDIQAEPHLLNVTNINPYLFEGNDIFLLSRKTPVCNVPEIKYGSMANDGGHLLLNAYDMQALLNEESLACKFIRPFLGSEEYINGVKRYCIWLKDVPPNEYSQLRGIMLRVKAVKDYRLRSKRLATRKLADIPMLFGEIRQPVTNYLLIPGVSSENRRYIPIGFLNSSIIASDLARTVPDANFYLFGVITSLMHMTWVKYVCGRLESRFRYSNSLVYNNFPWPENPSAKQINAVETAAQKVLDIRAEFPSCTLAELYNPLTMPPALVKAHHELDRAVDLCYRAQPFTTEAKRMEFLFELYEKYTADLFIKEKTGRKKR